MRKTNVFMITLFLFTISFGSEKELLEFVELKMNTVIVPDINSSRNFFGFTESDDLTKLKLGSLIEVCKIPYSVLDTCSDSVAIPDILQSANKWYVPVLLDNKVKIFIEIKSFNASFKVGAVGMTSLADAWNSVLKFTSKKKYNKVIFVELIEIGNFSFYIPEEGKNNLTSLLRDTTSGNGLLKAPEKVYEKVSKSNNTINVIKQFVQSRKRVKQ